MDDAGLEASGATSAGSALDAAVAALEEVVFSDSFTSAQETFCRAQCEVFEEREENRVEYMTIYEQWVLFLEVRPARGDAKGDGDARGMKVAGRCFCGLGVEP